MYCIYCGKKISNDSIFCCYCGKKQKLQIKNIVNYSENYMAKRFVISLNELIFYKVLLEIAKELNLILLCQVSLYSIIQSKNKNDIYFNKIKVKVLISF